MSSNGPNPAEPEGSAIADALRAGNQAFAARRYADAARHYARVVAIDGHCATAWYSLGNARWRRGDRAGAIEAYRRAVGEQPERARAWQNLSTAHLSAKEWVEAADTATKAVSLDPSRSKAWNNLAAARFAQGDSHGAETALRRAIEADPKCAVAWANSGRLLDELGRYEASRAAYENALALGETDVEVRIGLAKVLVRLSEGARAETVLEDALHAEPAAVDAWLTLGDVRRTRSAPGLALEAYEAGSAAAEDMPDVVRARLVRRRVRAALELAAEALKAVDRERFTRAAQHLREATDAGTGLATDDGTVSRLVEHCLDVAKERAASSSSPEWIAPDHVRGVLGRATSPRATQRRDGSAA